MEEKKTYKFLIIDDDKFLLDVYSVKFKEEGHIVETAFGAEEALKKIEEGASFDAVMLDVVMPGMDGFDFLSKIREKGLLKESAFIVLSNQGEKKDTDKAEEFNVDGYIIKANTVPSEVLKKVLEIVEKRK